MDHLDDTVLGKGLGAGVRLHHLVVATRSVFCSGSGDDDCSGEWEQKDRCFIKLKQLKVRCEGFGKEKIPPFTLGEGTSSPRAFVLNITTEHVEKVADGVDCESTIRGGTLLATKWIPSCPYHVDDGLQKKIFSWY